MEYVKGELARGLGDWEQRLEHRAGEVDARRHRARRAARRTRRSQVVPRPGDPRASPARVLDPDPRDRPRVSCAVARRRTTRGRGRDAAGLPARDRQDSAADRRGGARPRPCASSARRRRGAARGWSRPTCASSCQLREAVPRPRRAVPRPDPRGQPRPHRGGAPLRSGAQRQVHHLRGVVDPAGDHARPVGSEPHLLAAGEAVAARPRGSAQHLRARRSSWTGRRPRRRSPRTSTSRRPTPTRCMPISGDDVSLSDAVGARRRRAGAGQTAAAGDRCRRSRTSSCTGGARRRCARAMGELDPKEREVMRTAFRARRGRAADAAGDRRPAAPVARARPPDRVAREGEAAAQPATNGVLSYLN